MRSRDMRSRDYGQDVLAVTRRSPSLPPVVDAEQDMVVEDAASGYCGAIVGFEAGGVILEDRHGRRRVFPCDVGAFLLEGKRVTLARPSRTAPGPAARTASGSVAVHGARARVARASRIYVEGLHDAALVERVWGDDLRIDDPIAAPRFGGLDIEIQHELPVVTKELGPRVKVPFDQAVLDEEPPRYERIDRSVADAAPGDDGQSKQ